jgi:hypothetical protein
MATLYGETICVASRPHDTQVDIPISFSRQEKQILRELAGRYAEIAALPVNTERKVLWRKMNDLQPVRPLVWINEVCWNEMNVEDELTLRTESPFCRRIEADLRKTLYQWRHMQGDMVVEPVIYSPCILENTGFGLPMKADIRETSADSDIASRHFEDQIISEEDVMKIQVPRVTHHRQRSEEFHQAYGNIFDGVIEVQKRGAPGFWFAPWDEIVYWMGVDHLLINLLDKPVLMHKLVDHLVGAFEQALEQYVDQGLLSSNNGNVRIGSGAYGYTGQLPPPDPRQERIRTQDLWGHAAAQIFGSVSPEMHAEFALEYEMRWLKRFGLVTYGCCEPLHDKIAILQRIPNLRKISISPWADLRSAVELAGGRYVLSIKPSPSCLAFGQWDPGQVRRELQRLVATAQGNSIELVLKDISTVRRQPQRLWEWAEIAAEIARQSS